MNKHTEKIKQILKNNGVNQSEFAKAIDMLPSTLSMRLKSPDLDTIELVCSYFKIPLSEFFAEPGEGEDAELSEDYRRFSEAFRGLPEDLKIKALDLLANCCEFYLRGKLGT